MNKDVCKICVESRSLSHLRLWTQEDEDCWEVGIVVCPDQDIGSFVKQTREPMNKCTPPAWCYYPVEHWILPE